MNADKLIYVIGYLTVTALSLLKYLGDCLPLDIILILLFLVYLFILAPKNDATVAVIMDTSALPNIIYIYALRASVYIR